MGRSRTTAPAGRRRGLTWARGIAGVTLLLCALLAVLVAGICSSADVVIRRVELRYPGLAQGLDGFTLLLASDLHSRQFGRGQQELLRLLEQEHWNAAVLAGDFLASYGDTSPAALQPTVDLTRYLVGRGPCYYVLGNYEGFGTYSYFAEKGGAVVSALENAGARPVYPAQRVTYGQEQVWLSDWSAMPPGNDDASWRPWADYPAGVTESGSFVVAVTHRALDLENPDRLAPTADQPLPDGEWRAVEQVDWDLNLSGHTHGGQWRLPGVGPLFSNVERGRLPFQLLPLHGDRYLRGVKAIHAPAAVGGTPDAAEPAQVRYQVITAGLGESGPAFLRFRLFCNPEVMLITLRAGNPEPEPHSLY